MFAYIDDLIISYKGPETHLKTLQAVLQRLQEAGLKVKLSVNFQRQKSSFLAMKQMEKEFTFQMIESRL